MVDTKWRGVFCDNQRRTEKKQSCATVVRLLPFPPVECSVAHPCTARPSRLCECAKHMLRLFLAQIS